MYREPASRDPKEGPPRELVCEGAAPNGASAHLFDALLYVVTPVCVAFFFTAMGAPAWAVLCGVAVTFAGLYVNKRRKHEAPARLRIDAGDVCMIPAGTTSEAFRVRLGGILDVVLETKTEGSIHLDASPIPALQFANARPGPSVDKARVMLVVEDRAPIAITPTLLAYMDATDQLGKVRVFLRKNGWVPEDERDTSSA